MSVCVFSIYTNVNGIHHFLEEIICRPADTTIDFCLLNFDLYFVVWCNFNGFICFTIIFDFFPVRFASFDLRFSCVEQRAVKMH